MISGSAPLEPEIRDATVPNLLSDAEILRVEKSFMMLHSPDPANIAVQGPYRFGRGGDGGPVQAYCAGCLVVACRLTVCGLRSGLCGLTVCGWIVVLCRLTVCGLDNGFVRANRMRVG